MSMFATYGTGQHHRAQARHARQARAAAQDVPRTRRPTGSPSATSSGASFRERWRRDLGLPADADPYYHYDLDFIVTVPNMDPHIRPFETIREDDEEVVGQDRLRDDASASGSTCRCPSR